MESPPAAAAFSPGDGVEVRTKLKQRHGGWYEATVESLTPAGHYVVLYTSPIDPSQPLRETVRAYRMRHRAPPGRQHFPFAVGQPVEVPYRDGWWPGVVEEVPDKRMVREYTVVVTKTEEKVSCPGKRMRRSMRAAVEDSQGLTEPVPGKRRKKKTPQESGAKKRMINDIMASAQVGEHQESIPVNMPSAEYDSTLGTNLVTQGDTATKSLDGDELLNMMADVACSNLLPTSHPQQDDVGTDEEAILTTQRVGITGDSVHDHQETLLVDKRSVKGHSTLRTDQVTPRDVDMEKLDGHELSSMNVPVSSLLGASNSQYHHDEIEKDREAILSTPRVSIAGDLVAPLSNESDLAVILSIVVKKPSVEAGPILMSPLAARGDDTPMNSLDVHGSSNSMVGDPCSSLLGASNSLHQNDESGKEHEGFASSPSAEIACDGLTKPVPGKRRKKNTTQESGAKKRMINDIRASAQVGEHQESIPVNMPSAEYDSTLGTNLVTQGDTGTKSLMSDVACSNLLGLPNPHLQQDDVGTDEEAILTTPRVGITGESVHDHQESLLVNKRSNKGHSTLGTDQVTPRDVDIEKLDGHELSSMNVLVPNLLGASNSQYLHDEAEKEQEAILSTPRVGIAGDLVAPLSNESDLAVIPSKVVTMPSVEADPILMTPLAARGDDTSMNSLDVHGSSNSTVGNPHSSLLGASNSLHQDDEAGKEHEGFASTPNAEIVHDVSAPLSEETRFPFVKRSPMWKYIDLEVIPKMRQRPHFIPLEQCPEVQREGIALGLVVTYENLMNSIDSLKTGASCDNFCKNKKIITNLEEHGFDVQHLRICVEELKRVKKKRKRLLQKKSATEEEALEIETKSGHLNAELEATNKATTALMVAVHLFEERRASLSERKEESEIINGKLLTELRLVEEELMSSDRTLQDLLNGVQ